MADVLAQVQNVEFFGLGKANGNANGFSAFASVGGFDLMHLTVTGLNGATLNVFGMGYNPEGVAAPVALGTVTADGDYGVSVAGYDSVVCSITGFVSGRVTAAAKFLQPGASAAGLTRLTGAAGTPAAIAPSSKRNSGVLHRNAIAAVDKLATPVTSAASAITEGGSTLAAVAYNFTAAAFNRWGSTLAAGLRAITPGANQAVRIPIAQVTGADGYDIFLSVDAAPLWVGRITEAQRASGGFIISAVGVVSAGSSAAGTIDIGIPGTGLASNVNPFLVNNAFTPATPTAINCAGYSRAHLLVKLALTDLRSLPALSIVPFLANQVSPTDFHMGKLQALSLLTAAGQALEQDFEIDIDGSTGLVVLIDAISGQGAAASIWVELA